MKSLNRNLLCAVDVETTGKRAGYHEIIQIAVQPLDDKFTPSKKHRVFYTELKPEYPERAERKALEINGMSLNYLHKFGVPQETAIDMFIDWFKSLGLPGNRSIIPLAHNWPFDYSHINAWLGPELMEAMFSPHYRDTMELAILASDVICEMGFSSLFRQYNLASLCRHFDIFHDLKAHDALGDALATAKIYPQLLKKILTIL